MTNCVGNSALHYAVEYNYKKVSDYLKKKGANMTITNLRGFRANEGIGPKISMNFIIEDVKIARQFQNKD